MFPSRSGSRSVGRASPSMTCVEGIEIVFISQDDELLVSQEPKEQSSIRQPDKIPLNPSDRNTGKPVKLVKVCQTMLYQISYLLFANTLITYLYYEHEFVLEVNDDHTI